MRWIFAFNSGTNNENSFCFCMFLFTLFYFFSGFLPQKGENGRKPWKRAWNRTQDGVIILPWMASACIDRKNGTMYKKYIRISLQQVGKIECGKRFQGKLAAMLSMRECIVLWSSTHPNTYAWCAARKRKVNSIFACSCKWKMGPLPRHAKQLYLHST